MQKKASIIIRTAEEGKDEADLAHITSECFGPITPRTMRRWIHREKKDALGQDRFFVAEINGKVVANVSVSPRKLHLGEGVYVKTLGVLGVCTGSEHRKQGLATSMLQQALAYADKAGFSNSTLYTAIMIPAHRIYHRLGFRDIETTTRYVKYLDYDYVFRRWVRWCNHYLKHSSVAQKTLQNWNRSVVFNLGKEGVQAFRFRNGHFQRLSKLPRTADILINTTVESLTRVMSGAYEFGSNVLENAVKTGQMQVQKGSDSDLRVLNKILVGMWDE
jgi:predicted N-acetyltransferase YhbS